MANKFRLLRRRMQLKELVIFAFNRATFCARTPHGCLKTNSRNEQHVAAAAVRTTNIRAVKSKPSSSKQKQQNSKAAWHNCQFECTLINLFFMLCPGFLWPVLPLVLLLPLLPSLKRCQSARRMPGQFPVPPDTISYFQRCCFYFFSLIFFWTHQQEPEQQELVELEVLPHNCTFSLLAIYFVSLLQCSLVLGLWLQSLLIACSALV